MSDLDIPSMEQRTLWRMSHFDKSQRVDPSHDYWHENLNRTTWDDVVFQFTVGGRIIYRDPKGDQEVRPGTAILFTHSEPTSYGRPNGWREPYQAEYVALSGAGLGDHWKLLRERHGSVIMLGLNHPLREEMQAFIDQILGHAAGAGHDRFAMSSMVHAFVMSLFRHLEARLSEGLSPVERAVEELLRNPSIQGGIKQVALRHGVSREHLSRVFRERVGQTPAAFLAASKVTRAMDLLRNTNLTVAQIAEQSGFASKHTLARRIRRASGKPPSEARK